MYDAQLLRRYVQRGLATAVSEEPLTVQLHFEPKGRSKAGDAYYLVRCDACDACRCCMLPCCSNTTTSEAINDAGSCSAWDNLLGGQSKPFWGVKVPPLVETAAAV